MRNYQSIRSACTLPVSHQRESHMATTYSTAVYNCTGWFKWSNGEVFDY
jgi:hypothetical protein